MFKVCAVDTKGVTIKFAFIEDLICADAFAAGLHTQYLCDVFVNYVQLFSHLTPGVRLYPGVVD